MSKIIGILGGLGPMATADLFKKIIENTPAASDQEHIQIIINNNPKIPSRVSGILEGTTSPLPELIKSAEVLEGAGVDFIVIPCHTAHYWLNELQSVLKTPIYSLVDMTVLYIKENYKNLDGKLLLFATEATIKTGLYQKALKDLGCKLCIPETDEQQVITSAISEVKAGYIMWNPFIPQLEGIVERYRTEGNVALLAGCTEISLLLPYLKNKVEKIDPTLILAKQAIDLAN